MPIHGSQKSRSGSMTNVFDPYDETNHTSEQPSSSQISINFRTLIQAKSKHTCSPIVPIPEQYTSFAIAHNGNFDFFKRQLSSNEFREHLQNEIFKVLTNLQKEEQKSKASCYLLTISFSCNNVKIKTIKHMISAKKINDGSVQSYSENCAKSMQKFLLETTDKNELQKSFNKISALIKQTSTNVLDSVPLGHAPLAPGATLTCPNSDHIPSIALGVQSKHLPLNTEQRIGRSTFVIGAGATASMPNNNVTEEMKEMKERLLKAGIDPHAHPNAGDDTVYDLIKEQENPETQEKKAIDNILSQYSNVSKYVHIRNFQKNTWRDLNDIVEELETLDTLLNRYGERVFNSFEKNDFYKTHEEEAEARKMGEISRQTVTLTLNKEGNLIFLKKEVIKEKLEAKQQTLPEVTQNSQNSSLFDCLNCFSGRAPE